MSSRPLHGESIYLPILKKFGYNKRIVLVPSTGNLYIYMTKKLLQERCEYLFSSPPRGIYISTNTCIFVHALVLSSRPLHGESIYLLMGKWRSGSALVCSRPLHGESIYLPDAADTIAKQLGVLVPSTGNLYIYVRKLIHSVRT